MHGQVPGRSLCLHDGVNAEAAKLAPFRYNCVLSGGAPNGLAFSQRVGRRGVGGNVLASVVLAVLLAVPGWAVLAGLESVRARVAGGRARAGEAGRDRERPATVNLVLHNCVPGIGAYQGTILDLAARGFLAAGEDQSGLLISRAEPGPATSELNRYERQVLRDVSARLARTGSAPLAALADACTADPKGIWEPFARTVKAEARSAGLCRPLLPFTLVTAAQAAVATGAIALVAFLVAVARPVPWMAARGITVLAAVLVFLAGVLIMCSRTRLTPAGEELAGRWRHETWAGGPAMPLDLRAYAVAVGVPSALSGLAAAASRRPKRWPSSSGTSQRPAQAWSSFTGTWRPVAIADDFGTVPKLRGILALSAGAVAFGWLYVTAAIMSIGKVSLIFAAGAVLIGAMAAKRFLQWSAAPGPRTFDGQVIARWDQDDTSKDPTVTVHYIAVDDGERGWAFGGYPASNHAAVGDLVRATVYPRSGQLSLTITERAAAGQPAADLAELAPAPHARMLTAQDVAPVLGPVIRSAPRPTLGGSTVAYRGAGRRSLIVTVASGRLGRTAADHARKHGSPVPGAGDEAWELRSGRTVIFRVGTEITKIQLIGPARDHDPELLRTLASTLAGRLAAGAS